MTRAKEKLYLSWAKQRTVWGSSGIQHRSRFIDEIDPRLIEIAGESASQQVSKSVNQRIGNKEDIKFWKEHGAELNTKKSGIRIDSLSDSTLDDFLSGNMSVEELLER